MPGDTTLGLQLLLRRSKFFVMASSSTLHLRSYGGRGRLRAVSEWFCNGCVGVRVGSRACFRVIWHRVMKMLPRDLHYQTICDSTESTPATPANIPEILAAQRSALFSTFLAAQHTLYPCRPCNHLSCLYTPAIGKRTKSVKEKKKVDRGYTKGLVLIVFHRTDSHICFVFSSRFIDS